MRQSLLTVLITIMLLGGSAGISNAQGVDTNNVNTVGSDFNRNIYFAIGANIGLLSGAGLAGRVSLPGGFAGQLAFLPVSVPGSTYSTHFNIGGEVQYAFSRNEVGRLYSLLGMGFYGTWTEDTSKRNVIANPFRIGVGIGYEYFTTPNFVISFAGAITYFPNTSEFFPLPEVGFFYYFR